MNCVGRINLFIYLGFVIKREKIDTQHLLADCGRRINKINWDFLIKKLGVIM